MCDVGLARARIAVACGQAGESEDQAARIAHQVAAERLGFRTREAQGEACPEHSRTHRSAPGAGRRLRRREKNEAVREAIEELIEETPESDTPISEDQRVLLANILKLRDKTVADIERAMRR